MLTLMSIADALGNDDKIATGRRAPILIFGGAMAMILNRRGSG